MYNQINPQEATYGQPIKVGRTQIYQGDACAVLKGFADDSFQCCVTSPPYWALRDYDTAGQIGAEMNLNDFLDSLVNTFRELRRVLKPTGTFWLNIGDSYTSGNRKWRDSDKKNPARAMDYRPPTPDGLKSKDLIGVPWRLALALQKDGWFLRSDIIWNKPNCQPESVKDRPTRSHEYLFLLTKSKDYDYFSEPVKETAQNGELKNRRSVWNINTQAFKGAHFAVFPPELVKVCLLAGAKENSQIIDPFFGAGTVGLVANALGMDCVGIEINKKYIDISVNRIPPTLSFNLNGMIT